MRKELKKEVKLYHISIIATLKKKDDRTYKGHEYSGDLFGVSLRPFEAG
jgi:hypothetical protein